MMSVIECPSMEVAAAAGRRFGDVRQRRDVDGVERELVRIVATAGAGEALVPL